MKPTSMFLNHLPVSASGFPVPRAAYRCSTPYHQISQYPAHVFEALIVAIGVVLSVSDGLMLQTPVISGTAAKVKSP